MDDVAKDMLLDRFRSYLDTIDEEPAPPGPTGEAADLFTVFVELTALRNEVRTESRLVKEALDQFRGVFGTLQASHATLEQELQRAQAEKREGGRAVLRSLLLDIVELRDRLAAGLKFPLVSRPRWYERLRSGPKPEPESWREGSTMTLRRLDQILLDRRVVPVNVVGRPFDPRLGRVVATVQDAAVDGGIVVEEVRRGFLWEEELLRTAEVIVNKAGTGTEGAS